MLLEALETQPGNAMMTWYPIYIDLKDSHCLMVGGGGVALRKAKGLLACEARVTLIAPDIVPEIEALAEEHALLTLRHEDYTSRDLSGYRLVFAATDQLEVNAQVAADAARAGILVNVVDTPDLCGFQAAAVVKRGPLQVAVHSGGVCPALSAALRAELEAALPEKLGAYAVALGEVRNCLKDTCSGAKARQHLLEQLARREVREQCPYNDVVSIRRWLENRTDLPEPYDPIES
jgi:siroheme synthase-like protein